MIALHWTVMVKKYGIKFIGTNRTAWYLYEILEVLEAGLSLIGSEIKSLRVGKINFKDGYVDLRQGEAFLVNVHIAVYENAGYAGHTPERERKLLLHDYEIAYLARAVKQKGLTVIPLRMYFKDCKVKIEIGVVRGKKLKDRRAILKDRAQALDMERELSNSR